MKYKEIAVASGLSVLISRPLDDLKIMKVHATKAKIAVAGGINHKTLPSYISLLPDIIIIGSGITGAKDPAEEAKAIKHVMA